MMVPEDLNIGETRVGRLDSGPNLQPRTWMIMDHPEVLGGNFRTKMNKLNNWNTGLLLSPK